MTRREFFKHLTLLILAGFAPTLAYAYMFQADPGASVFLMSMESFTFIAWTTPERFGKGVPA
jgi:hypothetical protein